jgi:biopolymer transport protein ExbB
MYVLIERGGWVMYPLIALSFLSIAVIVERFIYWFRTERGRDHALVGKILKFTEEGEPHVAASFGPSSQDFVARTLLNGLRHRFYSLSLGLETQAMIELKSMKRNLVVLDTIITAAPLLGILGTVIGIILSFDVLGAHGIADPKAVTQGISQALITTAYGLSVALITIFPYNYFSSKFDDAAEELEKYGNTLEMLVEKNKQLKSVPTNVKDHEIKEENY